jgi:hypothetical protein
VDHPLDPLDLPAFIHISASVRAVTMSGAAEFSSILAGLNEQRAQNRGNAEALRVLAELEATLRQLHGLDATAQVVKAAAADMVAGRRVNGSAAAADEISGLAAALAQGSLAAEAEELPPPAAAREVRGAGRNILAS